MFAYYADRHTLWSVFMSNLHAVEEEIYPHEYLWRSASFLLQKAEEDTGSPPSCYLLLPALLISFLAFEAFVNFCGHVLLPELWKDEKKHFKSKGVDGKLSAIVDKLPNFLWQKDKSPYQEIQKIGEFRDIVAHGKVAALQYVIGQQSDGTHFQFKYPWDQYLSVAAVTKARASISSFCQSLLVELRKISDHPHLNFNAFEGSLATGSSKSAGDQYRA